MNIAFVFGSDWPSTAAGTTFTTFNCYGLAKADKKNNIKLFVRKNTKKALDAVLIKSFGIESLENLEIILVNKHSILRTMGFFLQAYCRLKKLAFSGNLDAVITRKVGFLPYLYLLKKLCHIKVYFEAHDLYLDFKNQKGFNDKKKSIYQNIFLPKVNGIICHQNILLNLYKTHIPNQNYCLARTGIKTIIENHNPYNSNYLGYIGTLDKRKRIEDLIYALSKINNKDMKLLIIGGRNQHIIDEYLDLAKKLNVSNRVEITGWVTRQKVEDYLHKIKIGIVPLEDTFFNRYLTSPIKIFDYFSYGIPVIGSDLPTVREIVTDERGLFYKDLNSLVEAINLLTSSSELYNKFSVNINLYAKTLLWEKRGEKIINFIKNT